jgi:predicted nucleotidyltransferase
MVAKWKDDPVYDQETFNVFLLVALSNERGGNRDEVKNDIRAVPEVLTVSTVEAADGGVQKQLADHFLSTLKLRVRLPTKLDRDILTQQIANDINKMRGVSVRRHSAERASELREEEEIQRKYRVGHPRKKKRLIGKGGNRDTGGGEGITGPSMKRSKSSPAGAGGLEELKIKIRPAGGKLITSFEMQPIFNPQIWVRDQMRPEIRHRLQKIAEEFIEKLDLPNAEIKDIILTGSLANYNWSEYSDLDVHIIVDFREIGEDEGLIKKYFDAVRANWNRIHDIKVKGYEVELYVQDDDEKHTSTGIYSILNDEWELRPSRQEFSIDKVNIFKKARYIMRDIDKVDRHLDRQEYDAALSLGRKTKDKIKKMRRGGLEKGGIYSTENLAFKVLRRGGYMGKLLDAVGTAYDAQKSLAEQE